MKDTKILAEESNMFNGSAPFGNSSDEKRVDDLPLLYRVQELCAGVYAQD